METIAIFGSQPGCSLSTDVPSIAIAFTEFLSRQITPAELIAAFLSYSPDLAGPVAALLNACLGMAV